MEPLTESTIPIVIETHQRPDKICGGCGYPKSVCCCHYKPNKNRLDTKALIELRKHLKL